MVDCVSEHSQMAQCCQIESNGTVSRYRAKQHSATGQLYCACSCCVVFPSSQLCCCLPCWVTICLDVREILSENGNAKNFRENWKTYNKWKQPRFFVGHWASIERNFWGQMFIGFESPLICSPSNFKAQKILKNHGYWKSLRWSWKVLEYWYVSMRTIISFGTVGCLKY